MRLLGLEIRTITEADRDRAEQTFLVDAYSKRLALLRRTIAQLHAERLGS